MRRKISKFNIDHIILFEMDWIDSCMKKWKTNIFLIFVVIFYGASEDVYSKNICIANGSDVFRPLSVLDEPKTNKDYIYHYRDGSNINIKALHLILLVGLQLRLQVKL